MSQFFTRFDNHIKLHVRLTPKAHKDQIDGVEFSADGKSFMKARVRAVPEKGNANKALEKLLAKHFTVPKSCVKITSGATSRIKTVSITANPDRIIRKIQGSFESD